MYFDFTSYDNLTSAPRELLEFCQRDFHRHPPFDPLLLQFCQELSSIFSKDNDPDIASLGFWLRAAHIQELKTNFIASINVHTHKTSRGLAFHITASNVDTLFVYSWMLSLLAGNGNVIRVPTKQDSAIDSILSKILNCLNQKKFAPIAQTTCLLRYAHQTAITELLSTHADIRIIWGSNDTIKNIRNIPLNPYAKELAFPDRFSYSLIASQEYLHSDDSAKKILAQAFFRDAYGYDQHGCSSPRLLFWVGAPSQSRQAAADFFKYLQSECSRRNYQLPLSDFLHKQTAIYVLCSRIPIDEAQVISNELSVLTLKELPETARQHPGAGLFYQININDITELARFVSKQDQTLTYYGFDSSMIAKIVSLLNGKGPSRFVPIGQALLFSETWDGFSLLQELTRSIEVLSPPHSLEIGRPA